MSGLSFNGATPGATVVIPSPAPVPVPVVTNDGWFPDVDPNALRVAQRIRDNVTPERLRDAIVGAMVTVNNDLAGWRQANETDSARFEVVPAVKLGGESRLVILYRRAIGCFVKADLTERNRDADVTGAGLTRADALEPTIDELRRDGIHAIRDILGQSRTTVDLI